MAQRIRNGCHTTFEGVKPLQAPRFAAFYRAHTMACKKYYFEHDYYGVGFYEEEVTTKLQQGGAATANASHTEEVAGILEKLGHLNAVTDHNYNRGENNIRGKPGEPAHGGQEWGFRKPMRKKLAELINVEECTVKVWFNNRRAKLRKHQKALIQKSTFPSIHNRFSMKILKETKNVVVLQEPLRNGFFCYKPHASHPNWR
ncbi:rhox homeobox family member 2-like protein [Cricetulus griseus]|nr:rhox homeobox family member 2-like protein [Cricetulus griseus]